MNPLNWIASVLPAVKVLRWLLAESGYQTKIATWLAAENAWYFQLAAEAWGKLSLPTPVTVADLKTALTT